jgi:hypothetical protein
MGIAHLFHVRADGKLTCLPVDRLPRMDAAPPPHHAHGKMDELLIIEPDLPSGIPKIQSKRRWPPGRQHIPQRETSAIRGDLEKIFLTAYIQPVLTVATEHVIMDLPRRGHHERWRHDDRFSSVQFRYAPV